MELQMDEKAAKAWAPVALYLTGFPQKLDESYIRRAGCMPGAALGRLACDNDEPLGHRGFS